MATPGVLDDGSDMSTRFVLFLLSLHKTNLLVFSSALSLMLLLVR